ncbi:MAG: glycosyltransferase [Candidatus Methylomirabilis sp.]|nr:glycosyltransferase [Candidatus Methylomirabilis sp.]
MTGKGNHNTPACSLVIRCFNEEAHIGRLLTGIMAQTLKDVEIIVVDSGSTDATLSIASQYPVKILTITPEQFSFGEIAEHRVRRRHFRFYCYRERARLPGLYGLA